VDPETLQHLREQSGLRLDKEGPLPGCQNGPWKSAISRARPGPVPDRILGRPIMNA